MKLLKFCSVLVLSALTMSVFAGNYTAKVYITLNPTSNEEETDVLKIWEDPSAPADFSDGDNGIKSIEDEGTLIWAIGGGVKSGSPLGTVAVNEIEGLKIAFRSNASDLEYKMTFTKVIGAINIYDAVEDEVVSVEEGGSYIFSVDATNTAVTDRFVIGAPAPTAYIRDVTPGQWGTICYEAAITDVQGGVLYELTGATETQVFAEIVDLSGENTTVAGQPYVFKANADATQLVMPYTAGTEAMNPVYAKGLVGTFFGLEVPAGAYGIMNNYVVEIAAGNPLLANRAYINMEDLKSQGAPTRGRAIFMIKDATTDMPAIKAAGMMNGTYMVNGHIMIVKDGKMFNVLGL